MDFSKIPKHKHAQFFKLFDSEKWAGVYAMMAKYKVKPGCSFCNVKIKDLREWVTYATEEEILVRP